MLAEETIKKVAKRWGLINPVIETQYHAEAERLIVLLSTDSKKLVLRGLQDSISEAVIIGNISAQKYVYEKANLAPFILPTADGLAYIHAEGYWFYFMEYIDGANLEETAADEFELGRLARRLHAITGYKRLSAFSHDKKEFYEWFHDKAFKQAFDKILDDLPDFAGSDSDYCLIHSDIGPHNAMRRRTGEAVFVDFDDAGLGSRYLDLGWAFIMQFVAFHRETGEMNYHFDLAHAFLSGYYEGETLSKAEYNKIWEGAVYMHISYMQCYGAEAVDSLWSILNFGMAQKDALWELIQTRGAIALA